MCTCYTVAASIGISDLKTVLPVLGMVTFLASMFLMLAQHDRNEFLLTAPQVLWADGRADWLGQ